MKKREKILKYGDSRCTYCGTLLTKSNFTLDHVYPRCKGGVSSYKNLKPSCKLCNHIKAQLDIHSFRKRIIEIYKENRKISEIVKNRYKLEENSCAKDIVFYFEKRKKERNNFIDLLSSISE